MKCSVLHSDIRNVTVSLLESMGRGGGGSGERNTLMHTGLMDSAVPCGVPMIYVHTDSPHTARRQNKNTSKQAF